jgi:hypothetical protein
MAGKRSKPIAVRKWRRNTSPLSRNRISTGVSGNKMPHYPRHGAPRNGNGGGLWKGVRGLLEPETPAEMGGLIGASLLPGVGEAIDVADFAAGLQDRDLGRMGWAAGGLLLPFVAGSTLRKVGQRIGRRAKAADEQRDLFALPMDEVSRMARAEEAGFDTTRRLYRGTVEQGAKKATPSVEAGSGVFLTDNPDVAEIFRYDREYGEVITSRFDDAIDDYVDVDPGDLQELYARTKRPLTLSADDAKQFTENTAFQVRVLEDAKNSGYDSIIVPDVMEGVGEWVEEGTTYVILDPKNIRSTSATFDPAQAESANLLAGGAGLLGAGMARRERER